ncbi:MarR family transcriptional regulator [Acinetobacter puyangensis]|uniref:MarR family transcriptional regulator n=1 Tax=Acinetobacter puyangensis TaxID=1096779 RepID=UPI003A4D745F
MFKDMMVTSGTMTHRLQQLEKRKLIERIADPNDKRSLMVKLTSSGEEIIANVFLHIFTWKISYFPI